MLTYNKLLSILCLFATSLMLSSAVFADKTPEVLVTIKPLHSLVAGVMQGVAEPELLINNKQSLHHYNLRPSDRRLISQASLIFWIGPELEVFLPRILKNNNIRAKTVALINSKDIIKLETGSKHHHGSHQTSRHQQQIDPHIWLSTRNATALVNEITRQLIQIDPLHGDHYVSNSNKLRGSIRTLASEITPKMKNKTRPYITYHNAIRYFEDEFGLNNIASVKPNSETQPSARHISSISQMIKNENVRCLFYNQPEKPRLIRSLQDQSNATATALDPVGVNIEPGQNAWFEIMQDVTSGLSSCLKNQ